MRAVARQRHQKAATARLLLPHERESTGRVLAALDDDVLEEIAEVGFDGALVPWLDFEVVGHCSMRGDAAVGLGQHGARGVAVLGAPGLQLLKGLEPRIETGQFVFPGSYRPRPPLVLDARARQLGLSGHLGDAGRLHRVVRTA